MRHRAPRFVTMAAAFLAVTSIPVSTLAQDAYPSKPIKIIASAPPGGAYDFVARALAEGLRVSTGQPGVVENKPGAGGMIGTEAAARSAPDGYTLMVGSTGPFSVTPSLYAKLRYDPVKDFVPIARIVRIPSYLVVHPSVPAKTVQELIQLARSQPGKLTYASSGNGLSQHTNVELFKFMTNTDILTVTYKGSGPANIDLLSGQVNMMIELGPQALPFVKAGRLRVLGVSTATRSAAMPDVPTIAESGVPGFDAFTWFALYAPAGTPAPIVQKLHGEVVKIFSNPEVVNRLAGFGAEVAVTTPDELAAFQAAETKKWSEVIKRAGIKPE
ncbi:Bug family tripartite tricarboxylate transporter substrate binding protein [Lacisediminimonas profundi]|uniref:Bug family tripartite tricarboxylate transporter substrate binding protein n=1 Tax=Lacisediminimonas profundi TaxID=2603856 RepID=UPI00124B0D3E|nr:tripartite tricarboxylate transporter substrate binding protein [Lacisediminimonas profundi]